MTRKRLSAAGTPGVVAFASQGDIYVRDLAADRAQVLIGGPRSDHSPSYSPDGSRLAFFRDWDHEKSLAIAEADGTNVRPLIERESEMWRFEWSPDGRQIVVSMMNGGALVVRTDGPPEVRRLRSVRWEARWLPGRDGFVISNDTNSTLKLSFLSADESILHELVAGPPWSAWARPMFDVAPDGRYLAYLTDEAVELLDLETGVRHQRPRDGLAGRLTAPRFSPDGSRLAALAREGDRVPVCVVAWEVGRFGAEPMPIGPWLDDEQLWTFSPDGQRILIVPSGGGTAWIGDLASGQLQEIAWERIPEAPELSWSSGPRVND